MIAVSGCLGSESHYPGLGVGTRAALSSGVTATIPAPPNPAPLPSHFESLCRAAGVERLAGIGWLSFESYRAFVLAEESRRP